MTERFIAWFFDPTGTGWYQLRMLKEQYRAECNALCDGREYIRLLYNKGTLL